MCDWTEVVERVVALAAAKQLVAVASASRVLIAETLPECSERLDVQLLDDRVVLRFGYSVTAHIPVADDEDRGRVPGIVSSILDGKAKESYVVALNGVIQPVGWAIDASSVGVEYTQSMVVDHTSMGANVRTRSVDWRSQRM